MGVTTSTLVESEGHPVNRKSGKRESGGPFYVTHVGTFMEPGYVNRVIGGSRLEVEYSGPILGEHNSAAAIGSHHQWVPPPSMDKNSLNENGATAISQCAPNNPTAGLATGLAEMYREGVPTVPGIQSWKKRTEHAQQAGSEYLNYQFGWAPLAGEIHSVVNAARHHRDIMKNYRHNEGKNVHRRFDFSTERNSWEEQIPPLNPNIGYAGNSSFWEGTHESERVVRVEKIRKRWFEGCFTYGGPSKLDTFRRAIGYGDEADAVYGLTLSPDVVWNLTPWSWAVDWFTNAGDVIHNVTNFAMAGLVMRYGYMMEETISNFYTEYGNGDFRVQSAPGSFHPSSQGACKFGITTITKSRAPANPFGFGVGWQDLSPTQLAITAAIGITRSL